jgi:UDP-4-amino-4,6-dideoxy-N-acetyl-beta-L-altrosamine transaminase
MTFAMRSIAKCKSQSKLSDQPAQQNMAIPYGRQSIGSDDIQAALEVLRSDFLTQGPVVPLFEKAVSTYCGVKFAYAMNSATSALHLSCLVLGVGAGDIVWTTPITFVASANCALYCGAEVDFVDIDPRTYNMCAQQLEHKLIEAEKKGRLPKVVIPVHMCGQSCDMKAIHALSIRFGFKIIEDASHAIGGRYIDEPIGSCKYSDITVFSFHPVKIITTAEGGMALTNDEELGIRIARLRSHGITRDVTGMENQAEGPWYYEQLELGYNYRMTDLQAAIGLSQLKKVDSFVAERHKLAEQYDKVLTTLPVCIPWRDPQNYSAFHLYVVRIKLEGNKASHKEIFIRLRTAGIGVNLHYIPVYRQPYFAKMGFDPQDWPEAEKYYSEAITLPLYPGLTSDQQHEVVSNLKDPKPLGYQDLF